MKQTSLIKSSCIRCNQPCRPGKNINPEARPFRLAQRGLCENCVVTQFLLSDDVEPLRNGILRNGIEVLRTLAVQEQFAAILKVGDSELLAEQIDWNTVVEQWDIPFPRGYEL